MEAQKSRIEFLREIFMQDYKKAIKKKKFISLTSGHFSALCAKLERPLNKALPVIVDEQHLEYTFVDPAFFAFKTEMGLTDEEKHLNPFELLFNFFLSVDPTTHKEYLQWYLNIYRTLIKNRHPFGNVSAKVLDNSLIQDGTFKDMVTGGAENRFFEDMFKVAEAVEKFDFLKKTRTLTDKQKDINRYETYEELLLMVKPFTPAEEGSDDVNTLDHKELKAIQNEVDYKAGDQSKELEPRADLLFQNDEWVIITTPNKEGNTVFGKYTTWCTAGTRHGNMFKTYNDQGLLFILIRKGAGSKREIDINPKNRLQFHFETSQYMDAQDKSIKIAEFLRDNTDIKEYFKSYIIKSVLPNKKKKYNEQIKFLMELGYGDQLIKIYKQVQPEAIEINGFELQPEVLEELGDISSLQRLVLTDCGLTHLPKSLTKLKKLTFLCCSCNSKLSEIPTWINEIKTLKELHVTACDIQNQVNLSDMENLEHLGLDYNTNMTQLPIGLNTLPNLLRLTASNCNVEVVDDSLLSCKKLFMLDMHNNPNLESVPLKLSKLPKINAICLDDTKVSNADILYMQKNKRTTGGNVLVLKYN